MNQEQMPSTAFVFVEFETKPGKSISFRRLGMKNQNIDFVKPFEIINAHTENCFSHFES